MRWKNMDNSVYINNKHVPNLNHQNSMWKAVNNSDGYSHYYPISILINKIKTNLINSNTSSVNIHHKHRFDKAYRPK